MTTRATVLVIGLEPSLIDFSGPEFANMPGLSAEKVMGGLRKDAAHLAELGYEADLCLTDFGETAESVVREQLANRPYDCVVIGAGVRTLPRHFLLFEKLINVVHAAAPQAKICFNTRPDDTAEAVRRWV